MATGQYLAELVSALAEKGHEVTVVTGRRAYDGPATDRLFYLWQRSEFSHPHPTAPKWREIMRRALIGNWIRSEMQEPRPCRD